LFRFLLPVFFNLSFFHPGLVKTATETTQKAKAARKLENQNSHQARMCNHYGSGISTPAARGNRKRLKNKNKMV
jgi:hypothetical protein